MSDINQPRTLYVLLVAVYDKRDKMMRVWPQGVFSSFEAAKKARVLPGERARNVIGLFEDVDMGRHSGISFEYEEPQR